MRSVFGGFLCNISLLSTPGNASRLLVGEHGWRYQGRDRHNSYTNRFRVSRLWQLSDKFDGDTISHVLFLCTYGYVRRLRLCSDLLLYAPKGMYKSMLSIPSKECTIFM